MRYAISAMLGAILLGGLAACAPVGGGPVSLGGLNAGPAGTYEVSGVEEGDMLKLRAGPGTGFRVITGLPNGTVVRVLDCERTGGTRWCKAVLQEARGLDGYVSYAYLKRL